VFLAPEWLVHATPAIALLAMLISLASFVLALKTYRRAGARVSVDYQVGTIANNARKGVAKELPAIIIDVTNSGMTGMEIKEFFLRPPTVIGFLRIGPYLVFEEGYDVERLSGKKLPVTIPSNTSMEWVYIIKMAGVAGGWWRADESSPLVTDLTEIYGRIRKSKIEVKLGNGGTLKQLHLTYGAMITLGDIEKKKQK
jgi:hypothetical protein